MSPAVSLGASAVGVGLVLTSLVGACLALRRRPLSALGRSGHRVAAAAWTFLAVLQVLAVAIMSARMLEASVVVRLAVALALATLTVCTAVAAWADRRRALLVSGALLLVALTATVCVTPAVIDVLVFERDGAAALLHGTNPYAITYENPYAPAYDHVFFGPGIAVDGRLLVGFPYPPVSLLLVLPGALLGDVRLAMCIAVAAAAALLWWHAADRAGRLAAAGVVLVPGLFVVLVYGWTETLVLGLLAATIVATQRQWRSAPYLLGVLLVAKQYMLFMFPLLLLLLPVARAARGGVKGFVARALLAGALTTLPFLLWSPSGFWDSVVAFQFRQPFRDDSLSLLVMLVHATGWPPPAVYGILPLGAALVTAALLAWRAPRTPPAFAACLAVTLAVMCLASKQAFGNYYFLVVGALLVAAATWTSRSELYSDTAV